MPEPAEAPTKFGNYRGKPITDTTGKFTNLGDGLSKAKEIEGGVDEPGALVTFVVRCRVGTHTLELQEDGKSYTLSHKYIGGTVARIDDDIVAEALDAMEARIQEQLDTQSGEQTMPGMDAMTGRRSTRKLQAVADDTAKDGGPSAS
jgi:hypothetical protein